MSDDPEEFVVVCVPIKQMPSPPTWASAKICAECGERIWLADSSPQNSKCICEKCFFLTVSDGDEVYVTPNQLKDALRALGKEQ